MPDIFISYCEEDGRIAEQIADGLQAAGYSTWHYEKDGLPGTDYIETIGEVIDSSRAYIVIISPKSTQSTQVYRELVRAVEKEKPIFPLLHGLKHAEFQEHNQKWRQALGATTSINIPGADVAAVLPRLLAGLQKKEVLPSGPINTASVPASESEHSPRRRGLPVWAYAAVGVLIVAAAVGITLSLHRPPAVATMPVFTPPAKTQPVITVSNSGNTPPPASSIATSPSATPSLTPSPTGVSTVPLNLKASQLQFLSLPYIRHIVWSPDSLWIAVASYHVDFLNTQTYQTKYTIDSVQWPEDITFSPDGSSLAYVNEQVSFIKTGTWGDLGTLAGSDKTTVLAYSPDGKTLATAIGNVVKLWDLTTGKELQTFPGTFGKAVAISNDGKILATAGGMAGTDILLWDLETGKQLSTLTGHTNWIHSLNFSPDGRVLASGSVDKSIRLWDLTSLRLAGVLNGHTGEVTSVAFSPDSRLLASASRDLSVKIWDVAAGQELQSLLGHTNWVECVVFSPDGNLLASGADDGLRLWTLSQ